MAVSNPKSLLYVIMWYDGDELTWHYDPTLSQKTAVRDVKELMDEVEEFDETGQIMVIKAPKTFSLAWGRDLLNVITGDRDEDRGKVQGKTYTPKQFLRKFG